MLSKRNRIKTLTNQHGNILLTIRPSELTDSSGRVRITIPTVWNNKSYHKESQNKLGKKEMYIFGKSRVGMKI